MTERDIQNHLWLWLKQRGHHSMCSNYTPDLWFEMDMFSLTRSGFMIEHEIKVTLRDFLNDSKKSMSLMRGGRQVKKHDMFEAKVSDKIPSRFHFVVPQGLIRLEDVPAWAGLIEAEDLRVERAGRRRRNKIMFTILKEAPRLHQEKVRPEVVKHVNSVFYWRFWAERRRRL